MATTMHKETNNWVIFSFLAPSIKMQTATLSQKTEIYNPYALCGTHCVECTVCTPHSTHSLPPDSQHHNSYNRTENHRQWHAVWPPDDGRKNARNMLRNNWLPIKSLIVASSWSRLYLLIKDARSFENKEVCKQVGNYSTYTPVFLVQNFVQMINSY